jgi:hypothetical protein
MKNCYNFPGSPVERAGEFRNILDFFIEKIVTINGQGLFLPEGHEGRRGELGFPVTLFYLTFNKPGIFLYIDDT